jgi:8-amino-7-oxononanoate synthase
LPDPAAIASLEDGVGHLNGPLIVVVGDEACGAVSAALNRQGHPEPSRARPSQTARVPAAGAVRSTAPLPDPPAWQERLRAALAALPPERQRHLRSFASPPEASAHLHSLPDPSAGDDSPPVPLLDLASNDYLGLSRHPAVLAAATAELAATGLGAGGSRLVTGTRAVHLRLERDLAAWLGRERVLLFPSGFQANLAAVAALADRHSLVLADRLIHHSLLAGVRASGARLQRFAPNNPADLERRLLAARRAGPDRPLLVLCESLYSMEGTSAPLAELAALCARHDAPLLVDEAHALGVLGPGGRGLAHGLTNVALLSGTFGKAFGSGGAFLAADGPVGAWLLQQCGAFRYTTALAPPLAAGAHAALTLIRESTAAAGAREGLRQRAARWRDGLAAAGWPRPPGEGPILPLIVGDDRRALELQARLEAAGLLTVAIRPPTVPEGTARLRLVLRQDLPPGTLTRLLTVLGHGPR